jgi:glycosyltransferase involved in cell wall biosynthesis
MKIAIQAADLDAKRIDGTRIYILNLLKYFGILETKDFFQIYHKNVFNTELVPPTFSNYKIIQKPARFFWTQTRFAYELMRNRPDRLWMPMMALPIVRPRKTKTIITVHDLAFKLFPEMFPKKDLWELNFYAKYAVENANKIVAVSQSTKKDILYFYPNVDVKKIQVIYHGFDGNLFLKNNVDNKNKNAPYLLYVGAIQPRKNLITLIKAFEEIKIKTEHSDLKLILAGGMAWKAEETLAAVQNSSFSKDIILTGRVDFSALAKLYQYAEVFIFPSLYEGFGIPILEAFASGVPVVCANNSSLSEVAGDAALYFCGNDTVDLAEKILIVLKNDELKKELVRKGFAQLQKFSWKKCAQETLDFIKS